MSELREFSDLSEEEVLLLANAVTQRAIEWFQEHNLGGLSCIGRWNLYALLQDGIFDEWMKHRKRRGWR